MNDDLSRLTVSNMINIENIKMEIKEKIRKNPRYVNPCSKEFQEDIKRFEFSSGYEFISFLKQNGILKSNASISNIVSKYEPTKDQENEIKERFLRHIDDHELTKYQENEIKERFLRNVDKNGQNGCHIWKGSIIPISGYGRMKVNGKAIRAHRLAYVLFKGPISEDKIIMHKCNNVLCVNPDHLKEGTNAENSQQMVDEKRQVCGNAKLGEHASRIRELHNTGNYSYDNLAKMFNVTKGTIAFIVRNEHWKDDNYVRMYNTKIGGVRKHKLTKDQENEIKEKYKNGMQQRQLSKDYGISKGLVYNVIHDKTYK
jgi:transposase